MTQLGYTPAPANCPRVLEILWSAEAIPYVTTSCFLLSMVELIISCRTRWSGRVIRTMFRHLARPLGGSECQSAPPPHFCCTPHIMPYNNTFSLLLETRLGFPLCHIHKASLWQHTKSMVCSERLAFLPSIKWAVAYHPCTFGNLYSRMFNGY